MFPHGKACYVGYSNIASPPPPRHFIVWCFRSLNRSKNEIDTVGVFFRDMSVKRSDDIFRKHCSIFNCVPNIIGQKKTIQGYFMSVLRVNDFNRLRMLLSRIFLGVISSLLLSRVQTDATLLASIVPTLLGVTCCTSCCVLLRVIGSCFTKFETGQTFSPI